MASLVERAPPAARCPRGAYAVPILTVSLMELAYGLTPTPVPLSISLLLSSSLSSPPSSPFVPFSRFPLFPLNFPLPAGQPTAISVAKEKETTGCNDERLNNYYPLVRLNRKCVAVRLVSWYDYFLLI